MGQGAGLAYIEIVGRQLPLSTGVCATKGGESAITIKAEATHTDGWSCFWPGMLLFRPDDEDGAGDEVGDNEEAGPPTAPRTEPPGD